MNKWGWLVNDPKKVRKVTATMAHVWIHEQDWCKQKIFDIGTPLLFFEAEHDVLVSNKAIRQMFEDNYVKNKKS